MNRSASFFRFNFLFSIFYFRFSNLVLNMHTQKSIINGIIILLSYLFIILFKQKFLNM
jgi:hypothetical protein